LLQEADVPNQNEVSEGILQGFLDKATGRKPGGKGKGLLGAGMHALKVPGFKKGGKVKKTGIYKLHAGEHVETPEQFRKRKLGHKG
jgi:hypothetical protein